MIRVVAGIIVDDEDKVLIAQRKQGKHMEFKWEFPGGKVEENESDEAALVRELKEEFNIAVEAKEFVAENVYEYKDRTVCLRGYIVKYLRGEFFLNDHEQIKWVEKSEILDYDLAPADIPIAEKVAKG